MSESPPCHVCGKPRGYPAHVDSVKHPGKLLCSECVSPECAVCIIDRQRLEQPADLIDHPRHYTSHPSGVEAITICEHENFCIGNAMKYLFRAGKKGDAIEDLKKARWYLDREITRRERAGSR